MPIDTAQLEAHRPALVGHCYRMLGSAFDAEDAVQETMMRAWQHLGRFEGRSLLRTWLYKITTNVCLDLLATRARRVRPVEDGPRCAGNHELETRPGTHWIEPIPNAHALPANADPHELTMLRQSIRLAFVAALQHLPPRQRAALILTEVLGWSAAEVADALNTSAAAINSALQRARATLAARQVSLAPAASEELSDEDVLLLDRYPDAFHAYDVDALASLLREDAVLSMPPYAFWLQGPDAIRAWLRGRGNGCHGSRLLKTTASGMPAFAQYRVEPHGGHKAWALIVLELEEGRIGAWNSFLDVETLFPPFGLALALPG